MKLSSKLPKRNGPAMPDTTPLPLPECPVEGCPATIDHWHDGEGAVFVCSRQLGRARPAHEWERTNEATRCYAPRTESSPVKTAENPVVLPTVGEAVEAIIQSMRDGGWTYRTAAQAVLDLIATRVPAWVPVEPGTTIKAGTRYRVEYAGGGAGEDVADRDHKVDDRSPVFVDPRTVPAEPEDPRVAVVAHALSDILDDNGLTTCDWTAEAVDILARLDAMRADR